MSFFAQVHHKAFLAGLPFGIVLRGTLTHAAVVCCFQVPHRQGKAAAVPGAEGAERDGRRGPAAARHVLRACFFTLQHLPGSSRLPMPHEVAPHSCSLPTPASPAVELTGCCPKHCSRITPRAPSSRAARILSTARDGADCGPSSLTLCSSGKRACSTTLGRMDTGIEPPDAANSNTNAATSAHANARRFGLNTGCCYQCRAGRG